MDSVLDQVYRNLEIIVVDDGSTDGTQAIVERYAVRYPDKVKYYSQQNRGPGAARNVGMSNARGKYIAFIDADDMWLPLKLEKQVAVLERDSNIGAVYCDNYYVDKERRLLPERKRKVRLPRGQVTLDLFYRYFIYTSSIVVRRSCIEKTGHFREDIFVGEDYHYFLRLSAICEIDLVDEKLLEKRVLTDSLSNKDDMLNAKNDLFLFKDFIKTHPAFYRSHRTVLSKRLHDYHFDVGYHFLKMGKNMASMYHLGCSLRYALSAKAVKCLLLTPFPYDFVRFFKEQVLRKREPLETNISGRE
jgi:glycosyltransferase involved in cell wall biosynthesis